MPLLRNSLAALISYRLGYSPQRPYPWRWTTPLALSILLTVTIFFTCLNVSLSAYETVQGPTYFPNATLPALPMSNLIPPFLRAPAATFTPQTLHVGDTFRINNSLFSYTIVSAFDGADSNTPILSFPYFNNPFSDGCDVLHITAGVSPHEFGMFVTKVSGLVNCTQPTVFQMAWDSSSAIMEDKMFASLQPESDLELLAFGAISTPMPEVSLVEVAVRPCCNCADTALDFPALLDPPCSAEPARFVGLNITVQNTSLPYPLFVHSNATDLFASSWGSLGQDYIADLSELNAPFLNLFQAYYHLVRRDLGVILKNNIYLSPEMYNNSIASIPLPAGESQADFSRAQTSNETVMAKWRNSFAAFNETDRVPVLQYLRPVPRLKPLGSAITSVFVATFAMVSTVWTIFSVVAKAFVNSTDNEPETIAEKESFDPPFYREKSSFEVTEPTESSSFTAPYKDPTYADHRWNVLVGEVARLANLIENTLPDVVERLERIERDLRERNGRKLGEGGE
ncbi:hypothetical protein C8R47DRAFT_1328761 [Mycena vitilis]|nr:hypothetical protein C8R47DRAFT_1328761 [Mycena vitilis]